MNVKGIVLTLSAFLAFSFVSAEQLSPNFNFITLFEPEPKTIPLKDINAARNELEIEILALLNDKEKGCSIYTRIINIKEISEGGLGLSKGIYFQLVGCGWTAYLRAPITPEQVETDSIARYQLDALIKAVDDLQNLLRPKDGGPIGPLGMATDYEKKALIRSALEPILDLLSFPTEKQYYGFEAPMPFKKYTILHLPPPSPKEPPPPPTIEVKTSFNNKDNDKDEIIIVQLNEISPKEQAKDLTQAPQALTSKPVPAKGSSDKATSPSPTVLTLNAVEQEGKEINISLTEVSKADTESPDQEQLSGLYIPTIMPSDVQETINSIGGLTYITPLAKKMALNNAIIIVLTTDVSENKSQEEITQAQQVRTLTLKLIEHKKALVEDEDGLTIVIEEEEEEQQPRIDIALIPKSQEKAPLSDVSALVVLPTPVVKETEKINDLESPVIVEAVIKYFCELTLEPVISRVIAFTLNYTVILPNDAFADIIRIAYHVDRTDETIIARVKGVGELEDPVSESKGASAVAYEASDINGYCPPQTASAPGGGVPSAGVFSNTSAVPATPQCSDGLDNDLDGRTDYSGGGGDPECTSDGDNDELTL